MCRVRVIRYPARDELQVGPEGAGVKLLWGWIGIQPTPGTEMGTKGPCPGLAVPAAHLPIGLRVSVKVRVKVEVKVRGCWFMDGS